MPAVEPGRRARRAVRQLPVGLLAALALLAPAGADETLVRLLFQQRFPAAQVENVAPAPLPGLYEVYADGRLWYVDGNVDYVFQGTLADARSRRNLTAERLNRLVALPVEDLPLELAIRLVHGDGSRRLAVFTDPECGYCRQLEQELSRVGDVSIYVFLLPSEALHPGSTLTATRIWCAGDRAAAWSWSMLQGGRLEGREDCLTPFEQIAGLARKLRIVGTPTLIFADGRRIAGVVSTAQVESALDTVERRSAQAREE